MKKGEWKEKNDTMANKEIILKKLEAFIRKFYINELLKGALLFLAMGLLYFLLTVFLEYFFWLGKLGRLLLFWVFIVVELSLFTRFIVLPLLRLFKISKGIDHEDAARIIGTHFPEVDDKLLNFLQLQKEHSNRASDLLLAGIDQKATELKPVPFQFAVDFKSNLPYLKYALIPVFIVLAMWFSGKIPQFSDSYVRVVNYKQAYEPPAPFQFYILNEELKIRENQRFELLVGTQGAVIPENVKVFYGGESFLLKNIAAGEFSYSFDKLENNTTFYLEANEVRSLNYELEVINVPKILDFKMVLDFPGYLNKPQETIKGTGNAILPVGTKVSWILNARNTALIEWHWADNSVFFEKKKNEFELERQIFKPIHYEISASNEKVKDYEKLNYGFKVIPDRHPEIEVQMKRDTVNREVLYFKGNVSDDHGLSALQLVYYSVDEPNTIFHKPIPLKKGNFDEFIYSFPDTLSLEQGRKYELYFQVFDNDGVNGRKSAKSGVFAYNALTESEREEEHLRKQRENIEGMSESMQKMKDSEKEYEELHQLQKENQRFDYNDRRKFEDYLKKQKRDNELMQRFSQSIQENLEESQSDSKNDRDKKAIEERLKENERRLQENEELMKELEKYKDKLKDEDLSKRLDLLAKEKKSQQRSLEELLELTKRYYIDQKLNKLGMDLDKLAREQLQMAEEKDRISIEKQADIKQQFEDFQKAFDELEKENENLRNPKKLGREKEAEEHIDAEQEKLLEMMENIVGEEDKEDNERNNEEKTHDKEAVKQKQKEVGEEMKEMSEKMEKMRLERDKEQLTEDSRMLRQILDNLLVFSFEQEDLMLVFRNTESNYLELANNLQYQQTLKENFKHVDDSLYALSLRNPYISETVNMHLGEINFNMEKALERLAKNHGNAGSSHLQYILTNSNDLANLLDESLQNMDSMLSDMDGDGSGSPMENPGGSEGKFQLEDIIQKQEELGGMGEGDEENGEEGNDGEEGNQEGGNQDGDGSGGEKNGNGNEQMSAELFEIYKEQQKLRFELENLLQGQELDLQEKITLRQMEQVERNLLEEGNTKKSRELMKQIRDRLLRLKDAQYNQEKEEQRKAETNQQEFENRMQRNYEKAENYFESEEILNRQNLPLQNYYQEIIRQYFNQ